MNTLCLTSLLFGEEDVCTPLLHSSCALTVGGGFKGADWYINYQKILTFFFQDKDTRPKFKSPK